MSHAASTADPSLGHLVVGPTPNPMTHRHALIVNPVSVTGLADRWLRQMSPAAAWTGLSRTRIANSIK